MGGSQSARSSQYQKPSQNSSEDEDEADDHHISISNKMVERLVEDATLADGAAAVTTAPNTGRGDFKDKIFMEKLKCIDDSHSERTGLTIPDLQALAVRIDMRTANMVSVDPVCADCKDKVIECYNNCAGAADNFSCWDTVGAFTKCVQEASAKRLHERTKRDAVEQARRSRHMALAREHELRDLGPKTPKATDDSA